MRSGDRPSSRASAVDDAPHASSTSSEPSETFFYEDDDDDAENNAAAADRRRGTTIEEERASVAVTEREMETSSTWILAAEQESRVLEAKLERLRLTPGSTAEDLETLRIEHELKKREINVARLRHRKLLADLEATKAREAYALAELELSSSRVVERTRQVQAELERIQLYVAVVKSSPLALSDPNRRHFFYTDCHVGGLGKWFCECLSERPNWHPYPCQKWFVSDKNPQQQIYCPVGKVVVDFTDQPSFAMVSSSCPESSWLEDKIKLARIIVPLGLMVPTWFICDGKWMGEAAPERVPGTFDHIWFLKEADRNFGTGIVIRGSSEECFKAAEPGKNYVLQPSLRDPRCDDRGHKLGWRLYIACVSPQGSKALHWYVFCGGYLVAADGPFDKHDLSPLAQITKDRIIEFYAWDGLERYEQEMRDKITAMLRAAQPRFAPPTSKCCFELFGVDMAMSVDGVDIMIIEVNRSPRVKLPDKPMLHALLNLAAPRYGFPQQNAVWDPLDVDPDATDTWFQDKEEEEMELQTWGRTGWGGPGPIGQSRRERVVGDDENVEDPLPGAFGGDWDGNTGWGSRRVGLVDDD